MINVSPMKNQYFSWKFLCFLLICDICLVGITCVYVNPGLWLVNLGVLIYLPLTQRGSLPLKMHVKILQLATTFEFWVNYTKLSNVMIRLSCFESERKSKNCNFVAEKLDLEYLLCTNPIGFFQCSSLLQRRFMGKCTEYISCRLSLTKLMFIGLYLKNLFCWLTTCFEIVVHIFFIIYTPIKIHKRSQGPYYILW